MVSCAVLNSYFLNLLYGNFMIFLIAHVMKCLFEWATLILMDPVLCDPPKSFCCLVFYSYCLDECVQILIMVKEIWRIYYKILAFACASFFVDFRFINVWLKTSKKANVFSSKFYSGYSINVRHNMRNPCSPI